MWSGMRGKAHARCTRMGKGEKTCRKKFHMGSKDSLIAAVVAAAAATAAPATAATATASPVIVMAQVISHAERFRNLFAARHALRQ